ncbi:hypothetical protein KCU64_g1340, partial [Aureobasidium melanogenum]
MGRRDIEGNGRRKGGLVRTGIRSVSGVVGLASESIKARKTERHNSKTSVSSTSRSDSAHPVDDPLPAQEGDEAGEDLETEWNLDDAQIEIAGEYSQGLADMNPERTFMEKHNERSRLEPSCRLALPVVIPQRRPKDRSRGFIRAYAPVLQDVDIDQSTWLDFLDTLQKSSAADPWLNAINFASIGTMFMPHVIGFAVSYAIQQATNIAIEMQARFRTTTALRKLNEEFFQPRGLYCLIMTWNPDSNNKMERVNITETVATLNKGSRGVSGVQDKFRSSDGTTYGELAFPEVAPLVFPTLDELAAQTGPEAAKKKSNVAKGMAFVGKYWDKRATAEYSMQNPDSILAQVPQGEFTSRYADPNHAAASGLLISFVSGGKLIPGPNSRGLIGGLASVVGQAARGEKQGSEWERYTAENLQRHQASRREKKGIIPTPIRTYKKLLAKNVLYLMVVNMPSEEDMAAARAAVNTTVSLRAPDKSRNDTFIDGTVLLHTVFAALPSIGLRLVYGVISLLLVDPAFAHSFTAKVILSFIPELFAITLFVYGGYRTRDMYASTDIWQVQLLMACICRTAALVLFVVIALAEAFNIHSALEQASLEEPSGFGQQKIFIVGIHWNNEHILWNHWIPALVALAKDIGPENVFVSIYESGSYDNTKAVLRVLDQSLEENGIPRRVILDETTHADEISKPPSDSGWIETPNGTTQLRRIPYLARSRNIAMQPLYELQDTNVVFDKILFLNDVVFTTPDVQKLLATRGGDYAAACALDFSKPPAFYDTFALRDIEGHEAATTAWPYFRSRASREALKHGKPTPVESCWNGIVAMNAKPFYQTPQLTFRGVPDSLAKLHVEGSECCLIHTDNPLSREQGVWVNPNVRVGYNEHAYKKVNPEGLSTWMSVFSIARGLWTNRFMRWSTYPLFKERVMRRRVEQWKEKHPNSHETGSSCLINEMQILTWYGWAHV